MKFSENIGNESFPIKNQISDPSMENLNSVGIDEFLKEEYSKEKYKELEDFDGESQEGKDFESFQTKTLP